MKTIERRRMGAGQVKLVKRDDTAGGGQVIAGVGAVCYDPADPGTEYVLWDYNWGDGSGEKCVERILPGAFDKALSRPDDVRGLFNHDANFVLGRTKSGTMTLTATAKSLDYEITPGNTTAAKDTLENLSRGDVSGSSISFIVDEERWTETKDASGKWNVLREILSVTLYDVGPVTFPAYESTSAGVRAVGDVDDAKKALAEHRKMRKPEDARGPLAAYAARKRLLELQEQM
jgi:HK97 family phage prohead protease